MKEWFKDDLQRYFYDKRLFSTPDDKVYEPVFGVRFLQPKVPDRPEGVSEGCWVRPTRTFDTVELEEPTPPPPPPTTPPSGSSGGSSSYPEAKAIPKSVPTKSKPAPPPSDHSPPRSRKPSTTRTFTSTESERRTWASRGAAYDDSIGPSRGSSLAGGSGSAAGSG